jgi:SAM-dependent methyltransferase
MKQKLKQIVRQSPFYEKLVFIKDARGFLFDFKHNVKTASDVDLQDLKIDSPNLKYGVKYAGSDPKFLREIFDNLALRFEDFVFVDLGSGKGRALLIASEYPFKKIIGAEFSAELNEIAQENIKNFRSHRKKCGDVQSIHQDAAVFPIPAEPILFYIFNPFTEEVLSAVLENIEKSLADHPRDIYIFYSAPFNKHIFANSSFFQEIESGEWHVLYKNVTN